MNNYDAMLEAARVRFTGYDMGRIAAKAGVEEVGDFLCTYFFDQIVMVEKSTGYVKLDDQPADFCQTLAVYDWLCDRKPSAVAAESFCLVGSLPGVYVGGGGLSIEMHRLAARIQEDPRRFLKACQAMGGREEKLGDLGCRLQIFPDLPMCLKFYFADDEFPPTLTLLWDKNTLRFVRYETVYYLAGCLNKRLLALLCK